MANPNNVEELSVWQQNLQDELSTLYGDKTMATTPAPKAGGAPASTNNLDALQSHANEIVKNTLEQENIPSKPQDQQTGAETATNVLPWAPEAGVLRKMEFGVEKGYLQSTMLGNLHDYLVTSHPMLAFELGLTAPGAERGPQDMKKILSGKNILTEAIHSVLSDMVPGGRAAEMAMREFAPTKMVGSLVEKALNATMMGEKEYNDYTNKQMTAQFGSNWMSLDPDQRRAVLKKATNDKLAAAFPDVYGNINEDSKLATVGELVGTMADPTTVLPFGRGYKTMALVGGAIGVSDASLYDLAKQGYIDPKHVAISGTAGAILAPSLGFVGGKLARFITKKFNVSEANKILNKYEQSVLSARGRGEAPDFAANAAKEEWGLTTDQVTRLYQQTGRDFSPKISPAEARQAIEERASWIHKNKLLTNVGNTIDKFITPVSTRMAKYFPRIAQAMRATDASVHIRTHIWFERAHPFLRRLSDMTKTDFVEVKKAFLNRDNSTLTSIVRRYETEMPDKFAGAMNDLREMRKVLQEVGRHYKNYGYEFDYLENYFPRVWHDANRMGDVQKGLFNQLVISKSKELGRPLTSEEVQAIMRRAIHQPAELPAKAKVSGALRERKIENVNDYLATFYADPMESMHSYLRAASHDIERAKFFRKFGYKGKLATDGKDLQPRLEEAVAGEMKRLGYDPKDPIMDDVVGMLRARFYEGELSPKRFIQTMKNVGYSTTLGNPLSAITQLGDNAFSFYRYGITETVRAAYKGMIGQREITKNTLGLSDAVEELFANSSKTKSTLNWLLKRSGFNMIDGFGKQNILNAALRKYSKMVTTQAGQQKFAAKWGRFFENETASLMSDLKKGNLTDNVKLMLWHELADVQPIALSEMPEKYLAHPNGRIFYMLKTFTMKQLDFMRKEVFSLYAKGHTVAATRNLAAFGGFWLLANGTADGLKSLMTGQDFDISDNMVENTMQLFIWSRYMGAKTVKEGPGQAILDYLMPATNYIDNTFLGLYNSDLPKLLSPIPIVGQYLYKSMRAKQKRTRSMHAQALTGGTAGTIRQRAGKVQRSWWK